MHDTISGHVVVVINAANIRGHIATHMAGSIAEGVVEAGTLERGLWEADLGARAQVKAEHGFRVDGAVVDVRQGAGSVADEIWECAPWGQIENDRNKLINREEKKLEISFCSCKLTELKLIQDYLKITTVV